MEKPHHRHRRLLPSRALHLGREQQAAATEQCNELTPLAAEHPAPAPPGKGSWQGDAKMESTPSHPRSIQQ